MTNISLVQGDITSADVDAIVNAANSRMLGGGGVDGAIHRAAGRALLEACKQVKPVNGIRCPVAEARITPAGQLKARYVIHTVGPRYRIDSHPQEFLRNAYRNSLQLALENSCKSIAFPAISCGVYGYPMDEAAEIALGESSKEEYQTLSISFFLFSQSDLDVWRSVHESLQRLK
ncbi:MAG: O-acetyl-ADP-ribose deacetylase [Pseudomonadota bacterium]|nr:O-acetyl-ADP-ribose deacetylase [Pseudomonadota bacterium]